MFSVKASTAAIVLSGADVELNFACPVHQTNHRSAGAVVAHAATIAPENPGDLLSLVNSVARLFALIVVPRTNAMSQMTSKRSHAIVLKFAISTSMVRLRRNIVYFRFGDWSRFSCSTSLARFLCGFKASHPEKGTCSRIPSAVDSVRYANSALH